MKKQFSTARTVTRLFLALAVMLQPAFTSAACSCLADCEKCSSSIVSESTCCCSASETSDSPTCCSASPNDACSCSCADASSEPLSNESESDRQNELVEFGAAFTSPSRNASDALYSGQASPWLSDQSHVPSHNTRLATLCVWRN